MQGWLVRPRGAHGPLPMITEVHGGPAAASTPGFTPAARSCAFETAPSINTISLEDRGAIAGLPARMPVGASATTMKPLLSDVSSPMSPAMVFR